MEGALYHDTELTRDLRWVNGDYLCKQEVMRGKQIVIDESVNVHCLQIVYNHFIVHTYYHV